MRRFRSTVSWAAVALAMAGFGLLCGQEPLPGPDSAPLLSPDDLEQLVAPIALYPDPLIALILPASTVPTDVVLADRYLQTGGDPNAIDSQNWDDSVKGLARYPDALKMMDDNLDWTNQLGAAVLVQQADVMTAIQVQRAKAQALGNLQSTPQQQVITNQQIIQIVPADPQVIYVPVYDPQVVYVQRPPTIPFITFGIGFAMGAWIAGDCDWHNHGIYRGGYYRPGYGWGSNNGNITIVNNVNYVWRPNPNKPRPRPPYRPSRPSNGGGGQLPGWHRPPSGNRPPPSGNKPPPGGNKPPPGKPGKPNVTKPAPKPVPPANGNRPSGSGNRPDKGKGKPDQTKPVAPRPGSPSPVKPGAGPVSDVDQKPETKRPTHPKPTAPPQKSETHRQPKPGPQTPVATQPARPKSNAVKPATNKPLAPTPSKPAPKPSGPSQSPAPSTTANLARFRQVPTPV